MQNAISISQALRDAIVSHARREYPNECCGILLGRRNEVVEVIETQNAAAEQSRNRYVIEPLAMLRADRTARKKSLEVTGVYHSHPDHAAKPSDIDRELAWEGLTYIIVSVEADRAGEMRAWCFDGTTFQELSISPVT